jgi:hypothetical protein
VKIRDLLDRVDPDHQIEVVTYNGPNLDPKLPPAVSREVKVTCSCGWKTRLGVTMREIEAGNHHAAIRTWINLERLAHLLDQEAPS